MAVLFDAHNHLQDERFRGQQAELLNECRRVGVAGMVVNGTCREDWDSVKELAEQSDGMLIPSFGVHPWHVPRCGTGWQQALVECLEQVEGGVGEIGLDRWKPDLPYAGQEEVFLWQLELAAVHDLPVSIHCLRAWGRMLELLASHRRPERGFLLHSYGGPTEMVRQFADLGAYFSLPGYFAREDKAKKREAFRVVPPDRLLIETDAPDQVLPAGLVTYPFEDKETGRALNHPANLPAVYRFGAEMLGWAIGEVERVVGVNFRRLFGGLKRISPG